MHGHAAAWLHCQLTRVLHCWPTHLNITNPTTQDEWLDKVTQQKRTKVKIIGSCVGILPRGGRGGTPDGGQQYGQPDGGQQYGQPEGGQQYAAAPQYAAAAPQYDAAQQQQPAPWDASGAAAGAAAAYGAPAPAYPQPAPPQQQQAYGGGGGGAPYVDRLPLPAAAASETEAAWMSVVQEPDNWWDNRTVRERQLYIHAMLVNSYEYCQQRGACFECSSAQHGVP